MSRPAHLVLCLLALVAPRAAAAGPAPEAQVLIEGVPHIRQKPDLCGEACAAMYLHKLGRPISQDEVFRATGVDPALGRGAYTAELARGLARLGFAVGDVWTQVAAGDGRAIDGAWQALLEDLARGVPSIVCMRYDERPDTTEHFRLILGYDRRRDEVIYHEPAEDAGAYRRMARPRLLALWPLKYQARQWTLVRLRLAGARAATPPTTTPAAAATATPAPAPTPTPTPTPTPAANDVGATALAAHLRALQARLPAGFTVVVEPPFVVLGDEAPAVVKRRAVDTVRWAAQKLQRAYFDRPPLHTIDVWLFRDRASYLGHTARLFDEHPDTPYGYYASRHQALFMNIATGGGTLVHEMVHPYIEANFPDCPPWFNEGLASLYEQSGEEEGAIHGYPNWRLPALQEAIRTRSVPPFRWLMSRTVTQFYGADPGTNYAQARYLCYYLQQRGLLQRYYREFLAHRRQDPTGYRTLMRVLGEPDIAAWTPRWERFVAGLRFDG